MAAALTASFVLSIAWSTFGNLRFAFEPLEPAALFSARALHEGGIAAAYPSDWTTSGNPLILTPYPPGFHTLWLGVAALLGGDESYLPGRILATLALIVTVVLIYRCCRTQETNRLVALLFSLTFLTAVPVAAWAGLTRVDVPGIAFTLTGLWWYLRTADREDRSYLLATIPFILAGLTKQNLVAAPGAVILAELLRRRFGRAGALASITGGGVLAVFVVLNTASGGGFFNATFRSLADEIFLMAGARLALGFLVSTGVMLALTVLALVPLARREVRQPAVLLYLLLSLGMLAMTIGKPGANVNYYIEPIAALCVAGAVGLSIVLGIHARLAPVAAGAVAASLALAGASDIPQFRERAATNAALASRHSTLYQMPREIIEAGPVLAPPSSFLLFAEPRPVLYSNDNWTFGAMAAWGKMFDAERVIGDLRSQRISAVLTTPTKLGAKDWLFIADWRRGWNFWSVPGFKEALFESYDYIEDESPLGFLLFLPKRRDPLSGTPDGD